MTFNQHDPAFDAALERIRRHGYEPFLYDDGNMVKCEAHNGLRTIVTEGPTPVLALNRAWYKTMHQSWKRRRSG